MLRGITRRPHPSPSFEIHATDCLPSDLVRAIACQGLAGRVPHGWCRGCGIWCGRRLRHTAHLPRRYCHHRRSAVVAASFSRATTLSLPCACMQSWQSQRKRQVHTWARHPDATWRYKDRYLRLGFTPPPSPRRCDAGPVMRWTADIVLTETPVVYQCPARILLPTPSPLERRAHASQGPRPFRPLRNVHVHGRRGERSSACG